MNVELLKQDEILLCIKHIKQELTLYCNTCEEFGCNTCYTFSHNKHNYISIQEFDQQITTILNEAIVKLQQKVDEQERRNKKTSPH